MSEETTNVPNEENNEPSFTFNFGKEEKTGEPETTKNEATGKPLIDFSQYKEKAKTETEGQAEQPKEEKETIKGQLISGYMLLTLLDIFIPILVAKLLKRFLKKNIPVSEIQATSQQKEMLIPAADMVAMEMVKDMTPIEVLIYGLSFIYLGNGLMYQPTEKTV